MTESFLTYDEQPHLPILADALIERGVDAAYRVLTDAIALRANMPDSWISIGARVERTAESIRDEIIHFEYDEPGRSRSRKLAGMFADRLISGEITLTDIYSMYADHPQPGESQGRLTQRGWANWNIRMHLLGIEDIPIWLSVGDVARNPCLVPEYIQAHRGDPTEAASATLMLHQAMTQLRRYAVQGEYRDIETILAELAARETHPPVREARRWYRFSEKYRAAGHTVDSHLVAVYWMEGWSMDAIDRLVAADLAPKRVAQLESEVGPNSKLIVGVATGAMPLEWARAHARRKSA